MPAPLNVVVVAACPFPYARGTPTRIYRTAEATAQRGHRVDVLTYHLGDDAVQAPFNVHRIAVVKRYQRYEAGPTYEKLFVMDTLLMAKLWSFVRNNPVDVIHAHHYEGLLTAYPVSRFFNIPLVYDAHTLLDSELEHYDLGLPQRTKRIIGRKLDRWAPRMADHILSTTEKIKYALTKIHGLADHSVTIVSGGVEFEHFNWNGERSRRPVSLVYTGNLAEFQGIELMLRAFRTVRQEHHDAILRIVTRSPFDRFELLVRHLGIHDAIELEPDNYESLPRQLGEATIALNPRPFAAGMPQKLLNYMAAGCPIVSFAGSAENLQDGRHACLIEGSSANDFSQGILHLLAHPELASHLGHGARKYARAKFNWHQQGKVIEKVFYDLVPDKKSSVHNLSTTKRSSQPAVRNEDWFL